MDYDKVPDMLKWVEWAMRTSCVLTDSGRTGKYATLEARLIKGYVGRFKVQSGFVCNGHLDVLDRVSQHDWELALNSVVDKSGFAHMPPVPGVWLCPFAVENELRLKRYITMMEQTGTPPGVLKAFCDHEYIEAKKAADGQGFLMKCDLFRPVDAATEFVVTQCYWAYSGTFNREQDQRRNGVYAVKCIKYFIKVMDFMRHNDDSLKDITMDDIKSTFKMGVGERSALLPGDKEHVLHESADKPRETFLALRVLRNLVRGDIMEMVPLVSFEWLPVVFGMSERALAALEEINLCNLEPIDARFMTLSVLSDPRFLALKDRPAEQALALYIRSTYPNLGEQHIEAGWDYYTEADLSGHWPAILLQARDGMIMKEQLGRIVPEHEWPPTLVNQVDFFTYKGANVGVHKFCVKLHLINLQNEAQCLLDTINKNFRDSMEVKEQLDIIACRPIQPIAEILRKEACLRGYFERWEIACKNAMEMFEEGGVFRPMPPLEHTDRPVISAGLVSAMADLDGLCSGVESCGLVEDMSTYKVPLMHTRRECCNSMFKGAGTAKVDALTDGRGAANHGKTD